MSLTLNKKNQAKSNNLLFYLSCFLLVFIPLYPKLPLFSVIPGYLVRIRLEDILVFFTAIVWFIQILKKKIIFKSKFFYLIIAYIFIGFLSLLSGIFLIKTIPLELIHIAKSGLHWVRYIEYFSLFFFMFSSIKDKKQIRTISLLLALVVLLASIYGFGQKYLRWPVFSTMNREYSKGQALYLTEHARVQSTFGGHYDLAAFLVITLPILLALAIKVPNKFAKLFFHSIHLIGLWLMFVGSSKNSIAAYAFAVLMMFFFMFKKYPIYKRLIKYKYIFIVVFIAVTSSLFIFNNSIQTKVIEYSQKIPIISDISLVKQLSQKDLERPADVYQDVPKYKTITTVTETGEKVEEVIETKQDWSQNALKYGLSMGIRLDTLWPQAIKGLIRHVFIGSAYATLSKTDMSVFIESDSTDNNYLRTIGETGLFGFILFYGLVFLIIKTAYKNQQFDSPYLNAFNLGFLASSFGLLVNALTIDVFAASKVAFTFWALSGVVAKSYYLNDKQQFVQETKKFENKIYSLLKKHWHFVILIFAFSILIYRDPFSEHNLLANLEPINQSYQYLTPARCLVQGKGFNLCREAGQITSKVVPFYSLLITPFLYLKDDARVFIYVNLILSFFSLYLFYLIIKQISKSNKLNFALLLLFIINPLFLWSHGSALPIHLIFTTFLLFIYGLIVKKSFKIRALLTIPLILVVPGLIPILTNLYALQTDRQARPYYFLTLKQTNLHLSTQDFDKKPYLISHLNPYFVDFYSNDSYQVLPLSPKQHLFDKTNLDTNKNIWGDIDYSNLIASYQNLLENKNYLYLSEYDLYQQKDQFQDFQTIKQNFDMKLVEIDCDDNCRLYKLALDKPKEILPISGISQTQLDPLIINKPYSFMIIGNDFTQELPIDTKYNSTHLVTNIKNAVAENKSDFIILLGDIVNNFEASELDYFLTMLNKNVELPVFYTPGNNTANQKKLYNKKLSNAYKSFHIDSEYFIILDTDIDHEGSHDYRQHQYREFKKFIINNLIKIEKNPKIKNVFIVSSHSPYLNLIPGLNEQINYYSDTDLPEIDKFYTNYLATEFERLDHLNFYLISQNLISLDSPSYFYHRDLEQNMQYFSTSMNYANQNNYLKFNIKESDLIEILAPETNSVENNLEKF